MLAALHLLAALAASDGPLSALLEAYDRYAGSGELNSVVPDQEGALARVRAAWAGRDGVELDDLDGLTVSHADWWFNLRPSGTEPLLR
ncbi:phosphomannomutase CpsG, partial [Klebsiella pneumoniae]